METSAQVVVEKKSESIRDFLSRHMTAVDIGAGIIIAVLVMSVVFVHLQYREVSNELSSLEAQSGTMRANTEALAFTRLFIDEVLKADGEIDFDTRLQLESAVRALGDNQVFDAWQRFTGSATERQAQDAVKDLLSILVNKIQ